MWWAIFGYCRYETWSHVQAFNLGKAINYLLVALLNETDKSEAKTWWYHNVHKHWRVDFVIRDTVEFFLHSLGSSGEKVSRCIYKRYFINSWASCFFGLLSFLESLDNIDFEFTRIKTSFFLEYKIVGACLQRIWMLEAFMICGKIAMSRTSRIEMCCWRAWLVGEKGQRS